MNVLAIGDVVGHKSCEFLISKLPTIKKIKGIDFVIANGENSSDGNGITPKSAEMLFLAGVDVITTGNHAFRRYEMYDEFDNNPNIIRPANFPENTTPGKGYTIYDLGKYQIKVINLMGTVYLESLECPFKKIDELLEIEPTRFTIVDFHAEATSEKKALGFYVDGRVSAFFGTHTHVQTADECILPNGTGYITDVGMCGGTNSVLGVKKEIIISKFKNKMPVRFENDTDDIEINAIVFELDNKTGKTISVERLKIT